MSSYNGVGYSDLDTIGNPSIQDYLTYSGIPSDFVDLYNDLASTDMARLLGSGNSNYIGSVFRDLGKPATLEDLIVNQRLIYFAAAGLVQPPFAPGATLQQKLAQTRTWLEDNHPEELNYLYPPSLTDQIIQQFRTNMQPDNWVLAFGGSAPKALSLYSAADQKTIMLGMFEDAFADYSLKKTLIPGTVPNGQDIAFDFSNDFKKYLTQYISVNGLLSNTALSYQAFYNAFFAGTPQAGNFDQFFAAFVSKAYGDPLTSGSAAGTEKGFIPALQFNEFTKEVTAEYFRTIGGSTSTGPTSSENGAAKTQVMNRIFSLLVLMIESLQKVAAAQSDRLQVLSKWQAAYTDLQNQIKYVTSENLDSRFNKNLYEKDGKRADFNENNSRYTETIKARNAVVGDDAKNLQTQLNQTTDAVNQQGSMASSILQELTSIFKSLYR